MTVSETKIDFLGEMVGLDDLIKRIEELARTETSFSDPWFIGEYVNSCGNLPLTIPFKTFGDFVTAFSNGQHLSSVTDDSGRLRFTFTINGEPNGLDYLTTNFYVAAVSEDVAKEFTRVVAKYEKYSCAELIDKKSAWVRYKKELYATLEGVTYLGYRG